MSAAGEATSRTDARTGGPVLLFDGVCTLCNTSVAWLVKRDPDARIRFASLQSPAAEELLAAHGARADLHTVILVDDAGVHTRSEAVLRVMRLLKQPWPTLARIGSIVPRALRDAAYRVVARNRYRWFGRRDECVLPTPELRTRFLDRD